jgi:hypothetical protein
MLEVFSSLTGSKTCLFRETRALALVIGSGLTLMSMTAITIGTTTAIVTTASRVHQGSRLRRI